MDLEEGVAVLLEHVNFLASGAHYPELLAAPHTECWGTSVRGPLVVPYARVLGHVRTGTAIVVGMASSSA